MRYEFIQYETDAYGGDLDNKISTSFHADTLDQVIERMQYFLRGSGFYFDGQLGIIPDEDSEAETFKINIDNDNDISINISEEHSPYYYDFDRNQPFPFTSGSNDWDHYSDLPSPGAYNVAGAAQPTLNVNLDGDYEIKLDTSNINFNYNDTMAGYPSER